MTDKEIPGHWLVFTRGCEESWYRLLDGFSLVIACLKEEDLGAIDSKPSRKRSTSGTRSYNNVFIIVQVGSAGIALFRLPIKIVRAEATMPAVVDLLRSCWDSRH